MSIMFDTPAGVRFYQLAATKYAIKLEVETGLKHSRGSILAAAKRNFGVVSNTKRGALEELTAMVEGATDSHKGEAPRKRYPGGIKIHQAYVRGYELNEELERPEREAALRGYLKQLDINEVVDGDGMTPEQFEAKWGDREGLS